MNKGIKKPRLKFNPELALSGLGTTVYWCLSLPHFTLFTALKHSAYGEVPRVSFSIFPVFSIRFELGDNLFKAPTSE